MLLCSIQRWALRYQRCGAFIFWTRTCRAYCAETRCSARQPYILVALTARYDIANELNELIRVAGFPTLALPGGGGIVVHTGKLGEIGHTSHTGSSDLMLLFGPLLSRANTIGSTLPDPNIPVTFFWTRIEKVLLRIMLEVRAYAKLLTHLNRPRISSKHTYPCLHSLHSLLNDLPLWTPRRTGPRDFLAARLLLPPWGYSLSQTAHQW